MEKHIQNIWHFMKQNDFYMTGNHYYKKEHFIVKYAFENAYHVNIEVNKYEATAIINIIYIHSLIDEFKTLPTKVKMLCDMVDTVAKVCISTNYHKYVNSMEQTLLYAKL